MKTLLICACAAIVILCAALVVEMKSSVGGAQRVVVAEPGGKKVAYWWDPMLGASSISDHPGKSAMGMDLVPVYEGETSSGPGVRIDPAVEQNMGVRTEAVARGRLMVTVRAVGMLQAPETGMHDVTLKIGGYVQKLYADTEGMSVSKGQVLFDLYSPDLQVAEQELIAGEENLKGLDAGTPVGVRLEARKLVESAKEKLRLWDVGEGDIEAIAGASDAPKTVPFRSPADGHVMEKMVVEGSAVRAGMKIMRIEDHSVLWLDAQVYENQMSLVKVGQEIRATTDAVAGKIFTGKVSFIYPHLDHVARTELVRAVLDNGNHELKPGMYAAVEIVNEGLPEAVLAPREAIIDTGTRQIAFVMDPAAAGHFLSRTVRVGVEGDDGKVQILEGLAVGDQVVTSGEFLMDVESRMNEAVEKLHHGEAGAGRGPGDKDSSAKSGSGAK